MSSQSGDLSLDPPDGAEGKPHALANWLIDLMKANSFLAGMMAQVISHQASQEWTLTGGRRSVNFARGVLHDFDNGAGWYDSVERRIFSYLCRQRGCAVEIARDVLPFIGNDGDWVLGPVTALYNMDTTLISPRLSGSDEHPLMDYPITYDRDRTPWSRFDYYSFFSMPSDTDLTIGTPPLLRLMQQLRILTALDQHEQGRLDRAALLDTILMIRGMDYGQFRAKYDEWLDGEDEYDFLLLATLLAEASGNVPLDGKVIHLSEYPDSFKDFSSRLSFVLQSFALNLGYDPSFFGLGQTHSSLMGMSGEEASARERATTDTGANGFLYKDALKLNGVMPQRVHFAYEDAFVDRIGEAEVRSTETATLKMLFEMNRPLADGSIEYLGTADQFRQLAIERGILPSWFTPDEEDVIATVTEDAPAENPADEAELVETSDETIERMFYTSPVMRTIEADLQAYPMMRDDAIVVYAWHRDERLCTERVLAPSIREYFRPKVWQVLTYST